MRVLNVAEKNDAAKNIAALLSRGGSQRREGLSPYNKIYEFDFNLFNQNCKMVMTSVSGHLLGYEFGSSYRAWNSCDPVDLFDAPISKVCDDKQSNGSYKKIKQTLEREIRSCVKLVIWTDCDREGENIGFEIIQVCRDVKPNIQIYRAQFSEITAQSITRAVHNLKDPDQRASDAVDVRQQLDLRIGAAFTRFQTLNLKRKFPSALNEKLLSYGSCQFPTLGFVVERYNAIRDFVPEPFWKIKATDTKNELSVEFLWKRVRLFSELACKALFETCLENPVAKVEAVNSKPKSKWRPRPLDTVEMEKLVSRKLRINAKETMKIAEKLYMQGIISYPRTETNIFPKEMNLRSLVELQVPDSSWGGFAQRVLDDGVHPNNGNKSDQAHPPIHPTKHAPQLSGQEKRLYEFIVRHFLACVSKNAEGLETTVDVDIAGEKFTAKGLMIIAKNYLEVYPYDKWTAKEIHIYQVGDTFRPNLEMPAGETSAPNLLTEADLIALMDKHGIGTDATHAEHIETIKTREYVGLNEERYFVPKTLGMGLVEGYDNMGFEMSKPRLRAGLENDLKLICQGNKNPGEVLSAQIQRYKEIFLEAQRKMNCLEAALRSYLQEDPVTTGPADATNLVQQARVGPCKKCSSFMLLKPRRNSTSMMISCGGYPGCKEVIWLPSFVQSVSIAEETCDSCGPSHRMLNFKFAPGSTFLPPRYPGCIGCDALLLSVLSGPPQNSTQPADSSQRSASQTNRPSPPAQPMRPAQPSLRTPPTRPDNRPSHGGNGDSSTDLIVHCHCGKPAVRLTVRKAGANQGREFFKCDVAAGATGCTFFQWADESASTGGSGFGRPPGPGPGQGPPTCFVRPNTTQPRTPLAPSNDNVHCACGQPASKLVVRKDGPNKGKSFLSCSKPMGDSGKCGFFQWIDETGDDGNTSVSNYQQSYTQPTTSRGGGGGARRGRGAARRPYLDRSNDPPRRRKCGICHEEGHTKKTCPSR